MEDSGGYRGADDEGVSVAALKLLAAIHQGHDISPKSVATCVVPGYLSRILPREPALLRLQDQFQISRQR